MAFASASEGYERSTSVGTIAECIKAMGSSVTPFTSHLLKLLLHRMSDEDSEAKSNAAYGIGLLQEGSKNDKEILKAFPTILSKLEPLLQTEEARAKDNAAGCVSRMIMRHPSNIPVEQVLPALLEILPLRNDFDENVPVYDMIVKLCKPSSLLPPFPFPQSQSQSHSTSIKFRHTYNPLTHPSSNQPNRPTIQPNNHLPDPNPPPHPRRSHGAHPHRPTQRRHARETDRAGQIPRYEAAGRSEEV